MASAPRATIMRSAAAPSPISDLREAELDLLRHLQEGYKIETDTLGGDVLLRRASDEEAVRPLSATRNTIEALQERGLIAPAKSRDPLRIVWKLPTTRATRRSGRAPTRRKGIATKASRAAERVRTKRAKANRK
jgi:hypothetical protein